MIERERKKERKERNKVIERDKVIERMEGERIDREKGGERNRKKILIVVRVVVWK